jgi:hypothetical protein
MYGQIRKYVTSYLYLGLGLCQCHISLHCKVLLFFENKKFISVCSAMWLAADDAKHPCST